jgi:hypothetical protein
MEISKDIQKTNATKYEIACNEFKEFLKKYAVNKPQYVELLKLLAERPPKDPQQVKL